MRWLTSKNEYEESLIYNSRLVKSYRYGKTLEITTAHGIHEQKIKVISGKRYVNLETGEIFNMDAKATTRNDNIEEVKRTMKRLRRLIAHNFSGGISQLWITLTYAKHITDFKVANRDFEIFMKRLRRRYSNLAYIAVIEPQASGRWHYHVLLKDTTGNILTIPNSELAHLWDKGFTKTKRLKSSDKVGNYVLAYVSNLDLQLDKSAKEKKHIKGARLFLYPKGLRIYRASRNIDNPIEETSFKYEILSKNKVFQPPNFSKKTTYTTKTDEVIEYITEFYDDI